jgi:hypothetical protein
VLSVRYAEITLQYILLLFSTRCLFPLTLTGDNLVPFINLIPNFEVEWLALLLPVLCVPDSIFSWRLPLLIEIYDGFSQSFQM